jgi:thioredoxin-like negative regulator of GroEL
MTTMLCVTLVQVAVLAASADAAPIEASSYAEAHRKTTETGKPMVVMVGTDWCGPCQNMKKTVLPHVLGGGLLRKVAFAVVNADRDSELAAKLTGGGPIPQLLMYRKTANGWTRRQLVGGQSEETVKDFITEGLTKDASDQKSSGKASPENAPPSDHKTVHSDEAATDEEASQHG